ncbi:MAG TPA: 3-hydroxyacyl-CoA dehydrogenase NAD-binding domain-containing protein [Acidobacteriaceae bacterium]|nr:3-hydroxyacyl-CoA dehydrogenase NAD-binding domain-containing protein [Acidobacteriaceae bacterium]
MASSPVPKSTSDQAKAIESVAVIGAGERGRTFAFRCAAAGIHVSLEDVLASNLRKAYEAAEQQPETLSFLRLATSVEDAVRAADLVIDFVPDELESKLEIFCLVDRMAPPHTIMCSPTQLSISDLAACTYRAERCVAVSGLGAALDQPLALTPGEHTSELTVRTVENWLRALHFDLLVRAADVSVTV